MSNELRVGNATGVCKARCGNIRRRPESDRWSYDKLMAIQGTPWNPIARGQAGGLDTPGEPEQDLRVPDGDHSDEEEEEPKSGEHAEAMARRTTITKTDIEEHGPTENCPKCRDIIEGRAHTRTHSETCRRRIDELFKETARGRRRLEAEEQRISASIARITEGDVRKSEARTWAVESKPAVTERGGKELSQRTGDDAGKETRHPNVEMGKEDDGREEGRKRTRTGEALDPRRVVTDAGDKSTYDQQLMETIRYLRSGRAMLAALKPRLPGRHDHRRFGQQWCE